MLLLGLVLNGAQRGRACTGARARHDHGPILKMYRPNRTPDVCASRAKRGSPCRPCSCAPGLSAMVSPRSWRTAPELCGLRRLLAGLPGCAVAPRLVGFERLAVPPRDRPHAAPDILIGLVRRFASDTRSDHCGASKPPPFSSTMPWSSARRNARSSGWMFFFSYSTASSPMFLRAQNSKSIRAVVGVVIRVRGELQAQAVDHQLSALLDDLHAGLLVCLFLVHHSWRENRSSSPAAAATARRCG